MPVILTTDEECERLDTHALGRSQALQRLLAAAR
jgi:hypothetical protein